MISIPHEEDNRTEREQYRAGFDQFCDCDRTGDYLSAGELAALTPAEMRGYNAAIRAKDAATFAAYVESAVA